MHHVMTMEGCEPRDIEEIENDAVRFAKKLGHSVENLKILFLGSGNSTNSRLEISMRYFANGFMVFGARMQND
jgi:indole-3-glycerol phosphate synthase